MSVKDVWDYHDYEQYKRRMQNRMDDRAGQEERERQFQQYRVQMQEKMEADMIRQMDGEMYRYHQGQSTIEDIAGDGIREEIDQDILRRVVELAQTQPIDGGILRNILGGPPHMTVEDSVDDRTDEDKYLDRLGIK